MSRGKMKKKEREDYIKDFKVRLKEVRNALGMTQDEFSKELGVSKPTYVRYELGEKWPKITILSIMMKKYDINLEWLLSGREPMFCAEMTETKWLSKEIDRLCEGNEQLRELLLYMQVPVIEQVIMAKLAELKATLKLDIPHPGKKPGRNIRPKFVARPEITEKAKNLRERKPKPSTYALERV